jgi:drug/metabolite transporter (DMT)-like permease
MRLYWKQLLALGLLGYIVYQLSFIIGINNTLAGNGALIMASTPLWTASFGHVFRFEHLRGAAWLGLTTCLVGTAIVVFGGSQEINFASATFFGNVMMLLASAMWGAYTAFSKPVLHKLSPSSLAFLGLLFALPILISLAVPYWDGVAWGKVDAWVWLAILFSGGLSTGLTIVIWNTAIKTVGAAQTAVYSNLVPFVAVLASVVLLEEGIGAAQIVGGVLIIGGLILTRRARSH